MLCHNEVLTGTIKWTTLHYILIVLERLICYTYDIFNCKDYSSPYSSPPFFMLVNLSMNIQGDKFRDVVIGQS